MLKKSYWCRVAKAIIILQTKRSNFRKKTAVQGFLIHFVWYGNESSLAQRMKRLITSADDEYIRHYNFLVECSHLIWKNVTNQITPYLEDRKILNNNLHCRLCHVKTNWHWDFDNFFSVRHWPSGHEYSRHCSECVNFFFQFCFENGFCLDKCFSYFWCFY